MTSPAYQRSVCEIKEALRDRLNEAVEDLIAQHELVEEIVERYGGDYDGGGDRLARSTHRRAGPAGRLLTGEPRWLDL
jgi:hypothetical protein